MKRVPTSCRLITFVFCAPVLSRRRALFLEGIRISHPCGLRRWREANPSGPWLNLSPRKPSVPDRVQMKPRSDLWFPADTAGQPRLAHGLGASLKRVRLQVLVVDGTAANQASWL